MKHTVLFRNGHSLLFSSCQKQKEKTIKRWEGGTFIWGFLQQGQFFREFWVLLVVMRWPECGEFQEQSLQQPVTSVGSPIYVEWDMTWMRCQWVDWLLPYYLHQSPAFRWFQALCLLDSIFQVLWCRFYLTQLDILLQNWWDFPLFRMDFSEHFSCKNPLRSSI